MTFKELGLKSGILRNLEDAGYKTPTSIQQKAIPEVLSGRDVMGGAQTGTGKTAAFALPVIQKISSEQTKSPAPRVLVLTPTRELASQVAESFKKYSQGLKMYTTAVFGGVNIKSQISQLRRGVDVLVATPGRLLDHVNQGTVNLTRIETFILDEADRMLDMGFMPDIKKIINRLPQERQNLLFSATYADEIRKLANTILKDPVSVEVSARNTAAETVKQVVYPVIKSQKNDLLIHLIKEENWHQVLVFSRTKHGADRLAKKLSKQGIPSVPIHGDKSQNARTRALQDFKRGKVQTLVATDIAARGLDINGLPYVVNYDLPQAAEDYVHRIGRTGRAGAEGLACSFVSGDEIKKLKAVERLLKRSLENRTVDEFDYTETVDLNSRQSTASTGSGGGRRYGGNRNSSYRGGSSSGNRSFSGKNKSRRASNASKPRQQW